MSTDLRLAVAVAMLMFSVVLALVTSGAVTTPPREATDLRVRRWRWGPVAALVAAVTSTVLLVGWQGRALASLGAALALLALRQRPAPAVDPETDHRHAAPSWDVTEPRRLALLAGSLAALATGVVLALATATA